MIYKEIIALINEELTKEFEMFTVKERVDAVNRIRESIHEISPFKDEPVDFIRWVCVDGVHANDYNPNSVAPPEMELLRHSISKDGYTQPVVTWNNEKSGLREVIDGFHRTRVCKEVPEIKGRVSGFLPVVTVNETCTSRSDRMASTIRHNRARGKHNVTAMSDIVTELKNRNWKNARIAKELGMDEDEVLRLCQITGLETLFDDRDFSKSWEAEDSAHNEFKPLTHDFDDDGEAKGKTANTSDPDRIFHLFQNWECEPSNFHGTKHKTLSKDECEQMYATFLSNLDLFEEVLKEVISEWKYSCEHNLTNKAMNRIAWLGKASLAKKYKIPSKSSGGFYLLSKDQQDSANNMALKYLNIWLLNNNREEVSLDEAMSTGRQVSIY
jgi:ParB-like chromosome segregation protein Spo0J